MKLKCADDTAIFSNTPDTLLTVHRDVDKTTGLQINMAKTETICIAAKANLQIDDDRPSNVNPFKYLGRLAADYCGRKMK